MREPFYADEAVTIYRGDCLEVLAELNESFHLVITSPPYNLREDGHASRGFQAAVAGRPPPGGKPTTLWYAAGQGLAEGYDGFDDAMPVEEYEAWQHEVLTALWGLLADDGAIYYNHKPKVRNKTLWTPLSLIPDICTLHQIIIWARAGGLNYQPDSYVPTHEWIMLLTKPDFKLKSQGASGVGDVWRVPQEPSPHPAPFPVGIPARAIETTAARSVLDPFMGSGTTLVAAKAAGVRAVGIERSEKYCEMAVARLAQGSLFA